MPHHQTSNLIDVKSPWKSAGEKSEFDSTTWIILRQSYTSRTVDLVVNAEINLAVFYVSLPWRFQCHHIS